VQAGHTVVVVSDVKVNVSVMSDAVAHPAPVEDGAEVDEAGGSVDDGGSEDDGSEDDGGSEDDAGGSAEDVGSADEDEDDGEKVRASAVGV
jgi:hypothetical protein